MLQSYIGNTKITKLYKGSELWCDWSSTGGGSDPVEPSTFETIIFCQANNNVNINGTWNQSSYTCYSGSKSLYTSSSSATITSNVLSLPIGSYRWSCYFCNSSICTMVFKIEGDYEASVEIPPSKLKGDVFNTIIDFDITSNSNVSFKLSAQNASGSDFCRFYDWKLEKNS